MCADVSVAKEPPELVRAQFQLGRSKQQKREDQGVKNHSSKKKSIIEPNLKKPLTQPKKEVVSNIKGLLLQKESALERANILTFGTQNWPQVVVTK